MGSRKSKKKIETKILYRQVSKQKLDIFMLSIEICVTRDETSNFISFLKSLLINLV